MFLEITKAEYVKDYCIKLWFNNGIVKVVDLLSSLKGTAFEPLRDITRFREFEVRYNTIEWKNGADFAPEYLLTL